MNKAEIMRAAADRLDALARGTTPGPWVPGQTDDVVGVPGSHIIVHHVDSRRVWGIVAITGQVGDESEAVSRADAAWIAALSPALAEPLALLMRDSATNRRGFAVTTELIAMARLILGQPVPASEVPATVRALDALDVSDPERAHGEADAILLAAAPPEVRDAYRRTAERAAWWVTA